MPFAFSIPACWEFCPEQSAYCKPFKVFVFYLPLNFLTTLKRKQDWNFDRIRVLRWSRITLKRRFSWLKPGTVTTGPVIGIFIFGIRLLSHVINTGPVCSPTSSGRWKAYERYWANFVLATQLCLLYYRGQLEGGDVNLPITIVGWNVSWRLAISVNVWKSGWDVLVIVHNILLSSVRIPFSPLFDSPWK